MERAKARERPWVDILDGLFVYLVIVSSKKELNAWKSKRRRGEKGEREKNKKVSVAIKSG